MIPADLRKLLSRWDPAEAQKPGSTAPRVLYTIPNGGNPTGASMTSERKQEVYEASRVHSSLHTYSIAHATCFYHKYISKDAVDLTFSLDVGNNPNNPYITSYILVMFLHLHTSADKRLIASKINVFDYIRCVCVLCIIILCIYKYTLIIYIFGQI